MAEYTIPESLLRRVEQSRGKAHPWDVIPGGKTAFVVIDMQNYFVEPRSQGASDTATAVVPQINRMAHAIRAAGGKVVWVQTTTTDSRQSWSVRHELASPEFAETRLAAMEIDAPGFALWPALEPEAADLRFVKTPYSAFLPGKADLAELLRGHDVECVLIGGTFTNVCCVSSAQDAMMSNFRTIMVADCNAGSSAESHAAALNNFYEFFGDVLNADEVIVRLNAG